MYSDLLLQKTEVYSGSGYEQISYTVQVYDEEHHVIETYHADGSYSGSTWDCCYKSSDTDRRGTTVNYLDYDRLGRTHSETVSAGDLILQNFTSYDNVGRVVQDTDHA